MNTQAVLADIDAAVACGIPKRFIAGNFYRKDEACFCFWGWVWKAVGLHDATKPFEPEAYGEEGFDTWLTNQIETRYGIKLGQEGWYFGFVVEADDVIRIHNGDPTLVIADLRAAFGVGA